MQVRINDHNNTATLSGVSPTLALNPILPLSMAGQAHVAAMPSMLHERRTYVPLVYNFN